MTPERDMAPAERLGAAGLSAILAFRLSAARLVKMMSGYPALRRTEMNTHMSAQ
jgi:hypothetical protein